MVSYSERRAGARLCTRVSDFGVGKSGVATVPTPAIKCSREGSLASLCKLHCRTWILCLCDNPTQPPELPK